MNEFVQPANVLLDVTCPTKADALELLSRKAVELGVTGDFDAVRAAFDAREEEGSTGMMDGFAVPHAKSAAIENAAVLVLRFAEAVADWESIDGTDITVAIALLVPDAEAGSTHIALLAQVARALMDEDFRNVIRTAADPSQVADLINARLNG